MMLEDTPQFVSSAIVWPIQLALEWFLWALIKCYFICVHAGYCAYHSVATTRVVVPPISAEDAQLLLMGGFEAAAAIRKREITATQLLDAYLRRAETVQPIINGIAVRDFENARRIAAEIDEYLKNLDPNSAEAQELEHTKPLLGIPFSIKDHLAVKGLPLTDGLKCLASNIAEDDGHLVKRFRAAGAIPFAISNVPEALIWAESNNPIYGRTSSPYDARCTSGGSSGGEAALLGAAVTSMTIGSDIGGSIRIPAMFCGVFGLKPGPHLTDLSGTLPSSFAGYAAEMLGIGPMARKAGDLLPLLKMIVEPEHHEKLRLDEPVNLATLRIFWTPGSGATFMGPLSSEVRDAQRRAVEHFARVIGNVEELKMPLAKHGLEMALDGAFGQGGFPLPNYFTGFNPNVGLDGWKEAIKWFKGKRDHTVVAIISSLIYNFFNQFNYDVDKRRAFRDTLRKQVLETLGDNGILIYPSYPQSSYYHTELIPSGMELASTCLFNALALPACAVPMGLTTNGYPTAIQMIAAPNQERLLCAAAQELERAYGGWQPAPTLVQ